PRQPLFGALPERPHLPVVANIKLVLRHLLQDREVQASARGARVEVGAADERHHGAGALAGVDEVEPVTGGAHDPVQIPGDHAFDPPGADGVEEGGEAGTGDLATGGGVVVGELGAEGPAATTDEVEAVFALAGDAELIAAAVDGKPQVERRDGGGHGVHGRGSELAHHAPTAQQAVVCHSPVVRSPTTAESHTTT